MAGTTDEIKVYVGGRDRRRLQQVPTTNDFVVHGVQLEEGPNVITAVLVTPDGESGPSAPITITLTTCPRRSRSPAPRMARQ